MHIAQSDFEELCKDRSNSGDTAIVLLGRYGSFFEDKQGGWTLKHAGIGAVGVIVADQISKAWARHALARGESIALPGGVLSFSYHENTGMAFSLFSGHTQVLALLSLVLMVVIVLLLRKVLPAKKSTSVFMGLLIGGGIGNFIDRVVYGYVVDFIELQFINFPVFNIADIAVTVAAVVLMWKVFFGAEEKVRA